MPCPLNPTLNREREKKFTSNFQMFSLSRRGYHALRSLPQVGGVTPLNHAHSHVVKMASRAQAAAAAPKLFAVTLRKSLIGRPWWTRRTVESLGFKKRGQTLICKNTPSVNGKLRDIKDMIFVRPVVIRTDMENSPTGKEILLDNGQFFISPEDLKKMTEDVESHLNANHK